MSIEGPIRTVQNGLVLHLDAANNKSYPGSGATWNDLTGNGNTGTTSGNPTFSSAECGSIVFDGTDDYVNFNSSNNITGDNLQTLTVSMWLKYSTATSDLRAFTLNAGAGGTSALLMGIWINAVFSGGAVVSSVGSLGVLIRNFDNVSFSSLTHNDNYHLKNRFINLACVVNGTNRFLYIDGALKNSDSGFGIRSVSGNTDPARIGANRILGQYFNGSISNCLFYRRALSPTEVLQNYDAAKSRFGL